ncbi:hypothetical protein [Streptomyces sp. NPDC057426]|uniref:hypothetical protein n=1 Tax=Streptomyces sp. NPDC057426 TaxID=3346128 RepID=UPI0036A89D72
MRTRHLSAALAAATIVLGITACSSETAPDEPSDKPTAKPTVTVDADAARKAAGLPTEPTGTARQAFLDGLNAIDADIVHGKDDKAVSRGIDTCGIFKRFPGDKAKQVDQTNKRWTSPTHPDGHGLAKAEKILGVAHKNICPDF